MNDYKDDYKIGYKNCYISDHPKFRHICDIPEEVAFVWARDYLDNQPLVPTANGWLNKMFIIVTESHGKYIAIYKHDYVFSIYKEI